jgi:hypothetical protein
MVNNMSEKKRQSFMEMSQKEELGGSKGNQHDVFI